MGIYKQATPLAYYSWQANRELAETIHKVIEEQLKKQGISYKNIDGIIFYKGPGSFTGLRIGASVANALACSLDIKIVGTNGESWIEDGLDKLSNNLDDKIVVPEYGAPPNVTQQKK